MLMDDSANALWAIFMGDLLIDFRAHFNLVGILRERVFQERLTEVADQEFGGNHQRVDGCFGLDRFTHRAQTFNEEQSGFLSELFLFELADEFNL